MGHGVFVACLLKAFLASFSNWIGLYCLSRPNESLFMLKCYKKKVSLKWRFLGKQRVSHQWEIGSSNPNSAIAIHAEVGGAGITLSRQPLATMSSRVQKRVDSSFPVTD